MVDVFDSGSQDFHQQIDMKIAQAEIRIISNIKIWFLTGLVGMLFTIVGGFGVILFNMGEMSQKFEEAVDQLNSHEGRLSTNEDWRSRKDAIDHDLIRWAVTQGYSPPMWYSGNDAEEVED